MGTSMVIDLSFCESKLMAKATIRLQSAGVRAFSFLLNKAFVISDITCNAEKAVWRVGEDERIVSYLPVASRVSIHSERDINEIVITYTGEITSETMNGITQDIKALNYYSVWFPMRTSVPLEEDAVIIHGCEDHFVVKGVFDADTACWRYGGDNYQKYNILAYRKQALKTIVSPTLNIYYVEDNFTDRAEKLTGIYNDVASYYCDALFCKTALPVLDMAFLEPMLRVGGAYIAEALIVCAGIEQYDDLVLMNAHEMAHNWCCDAPGDWEDWLNETCAEWSALVYAQERCGADLFQYGITRDNRAALYKSFPPIKTPDGERPDGVHHRGTMLFYEIYKKHGLEAIKTVLRMFVGLEVRNTENLLRALRDNHLEAVADMIERGLTMTDYSAL